MPTCPDHPGEPLDEHGYGCRYCTPDSAWPSDLPTIRDERDAIGDALEAT